MSIKVEILPFEEYNPSTVTVAGYLSTSVDVVNLANFIPVSHMFSEKDNSRLKRKSGSRQNIPYFGIENSVISVCYKSIIRGMRTAGMHNMASLDIQLSGRNIHVKLSSTSINTVGTKNSEEKGKVFNAIVDHIKHLQKIIDFIKTFSPENLKKNIDFFFNISIEGQEIIRESAFLEKLENSNLEGLDKNLLKCFARYLNDFDKNQKNELIEKIFDFVKVDKIYSDSLECRDITTYNSVYHISPIKIGNSEFKMPLHRLAPFLAKIGLTVEYHNWTSEGVNVCIDAQEKKTTPNRHKLYQHRFTIHETTKIRQCSPTSKEEAYRNYVGVMKLLRMFFESPEIDFKKYLVEGEKQGDKKMEKMIQKIVSA